MGTLSLWQPSFMAYYCIIISERQLLLSQLGILHDNA